VAEAFAGDRIFGVGRTVTDFLLAHRSGRPWYEAGRPSAGNGALMRIAPVILPHLRTMDDELWTDVIAATVITHRDEAAVAASVGFVGVLAECLATPRLGAAPAARWWPETFLRYARSVETGALYEREAPAGSFTGSLSALVEAEVLPAVDGGLGVIEATERWHSGAYLLQTVPCVLYILATHGGDPEEAIVRAVNDTWDNDTIAAVVGAAVGALHGESAFPVRWRRDLLGRTREGDDGHVQALIDQAVAAFLP
jgi:ADP-ribosylglycohydrolase